MPITCIDNFNQLDKLQQNWNEVYSDDLHATIFVSWAWIRGWFEVLDNRRWLVLAWRPHNEAKYAAFLPLNITTIGKIRLAMGGNDKGAYAGFVCVKEHQDEALEAFGGFIQKELQWEEFQLQKVLDCRLENFLNSFSLKNHTIQVSEQDICPYINLPGTWDEYEQTYLSYKFRKNLRKNRRKIEGLDGFHISDVTQDNIDQQMDTFRLLYEMRWEEQSDEAWEWFRSTGHYCLDNNLLYLTIIWDGKVPVAGRQAYLDRDHRVWCANMSGWNPDYRKFSPSHVLLAHTIKCSIENGYKIFDFLGGTEAHKYKYGAHDRSRRKAIVVRKGLSITTKKLLRRARHYASRLKQNIRKNVFENR